MKFAGFTSKQSQRLRPWWRDPVSLILAVVAAFSAIQVIRPERKEEIDWGPAYAFTDTVNGRPLQWLACSPIPVLVNVGPTGDEGFAEIEDGLRIMAEATGIMFTIVGRSDKIPNQNWAMVGDTVAGWPYPAVLIAWTTDRSTDLLDGTQSGSAVGNPAAYQDTRQIVSGAIALNSEDLNRYLPGFGPGATRGNLILHELGHLVGLAHVEGPRLMNSTVGSWSPDGFTPEERVGLSLVSPQCDSSAMRR